MRFKLLSLLSFLFIVNSLVAQTDIVFIPDPIFKTALIENSAINTNMDEEIQQDEAVAYAGPLDVSNKGIWDLTGIEAFTNLTSLNCAGNQLVALDLSQNIALQSLDCSFNIILASLNIKNGNNYSIEYFSALNNPNLRCIQVDNFLLSTTNWIDIDATARFSENCSAEVVVFNDQAFKNVLLADGWINTNMDKEIQLDEAVAYVGSIDVSYKGIYDLTGIEAFKNITSLDCKYNQLSELNISQNTALTELDCSNNQLTRLDISTNRALKILDCSFNKLNTFLPEYPGSPPPWEYNFELEELICNFNELTRLDIGFYPKLTRLDCMDNRLTNLDFNFPFPLFSLRALNCRGNGLTSLDISHLMELRFLDCSFNMQLSSLITYPDGLINMNLNQFMCMGTGLKSLDLTNFKNLTWLDCSSNMELTSLYMKNGNNSNISQFFAYNNPKLYCIEVDNAEWSTSHWTNIDAGTHFSENCPLLWTGKTSSSWFDGTNWSRGFVPKDEDNIVIPSRISPDPPYYRMFDPIIDLNDPSQFYCNSLTIDAEASLNLGAGKSLTVKTQTINNGQLFINNNDSETGSLITESALGNGSTTIGVYLTTGAWHHVSSPLAGQTITDFLMTNPYIPAKSDFRAMKDYDPVSNDWNDYFNNATVGDLGGGKGFSMRVDGSPDFGGEGNIISFKGYLQAGIQTVVTHENSWNLVGNPYTSAIGLTDNSYSMTNFLSVNAPDLDPSYAALYVWDKPDASNGMAGQYRVISNCPSEYADAPIGQAFFVKMNQTATSVKFTPEMQVHNAQLTLKSTKGLWASVILQASSDSLKSSTAIVFKDAMTRGLDPTYDAGLLKGGADLIAYSRLVEDNGVSFAVQALPDNDFNNQVIPIGLDFKKGGVVTLSAKTVNLSPNCKMILEDKLTKTIIDLADKVYTIEIPANSNISDRFFLHTSNLTTENQDLLNETKSKLKVFAVSNTEIKVIGKLSKQSIATLYDMQGRVIFEKSIGEGSVNIISTPYLSKGIYTLSVNSNRHIEGFKIVVKD